MFFTGGIIQCKFSMLSRREKLLVLPWQERRLAQHRARLRSAVCAVDTSAPPVRTHVLIKLKKLQAEKDRLERIQEDNLRLWRQLQMAGKTKRIDQHWDVPQPTFLGRVSFLKTNPEAKEQMRTSPTSPMLPSRRSRRCLACDRDEDRLHLPAL